MRKLSIFFVFMFLLITYSAKCFSENHICNENESGCADNSVSDMYSRHLNNNNKPKLHNNWLDSRKYVHLCSVACGDRLDETLNMIKSALIFSTGKIFVHVFADDDLRPKFIHMLELWKTESKKDFEFNVHSIKFPGGDQAQEWKNLFKPCASQRIFIPDLIEDVDSLIYVDTDVLFLRPIQDLWNFFDNFNLTQFAGVTPEHEEPTAGWYNRFAQHPYVSPYGINSGVMLMNLTRIRNSNWLKELTKYYLDYKYNIVWGDQDLINIFFHFHPEALYQFPCSWNFRPDHCMYMSNCRDAEQHGASVLHGNRGVFHDDKMPTFSAVYQAFSEHSLSVDSALQLKESISNKISPHLSTRCGQVSHIFTKQLFKHLN